MKNLKNLGKILNKKEQKMINGGFGGSSGGTCSSGSAEECGEAPFFQIVYAPARCVNGLCQY